MTSPKEQVLMKKYASMLQIDNRTTTSRYVLNVSPLRQTNSSEVFEQVTSTIRKRKVLKQTLPNLTNNQSHSGALAIDSEFIPSANDISARTSVRTTRALKGYNDFTVNHVNKNETSDMSYEAASVSKSYEKSPLLLREASRSVLSNLTKEKVRYLHSNSVRELDLKGMYQNAKEISNELRSIINREQEGALDNFIANFQLEEFVNTQAARFPNIVKVVEKTLVEPLSKGSPFIQEIWRIVVVELNSIRSKYEEFLHAQSKVLSSAAAANKEGGWSTSNWEALKYIVDYSTILKEEIEPGKKREREQKLDDIRKNIYNFKLNLKAKRGSSKEVLELYELVESHIYSLDQKLIEERERYSLVSNQNQVLLQQFSKLENKQDTIKNEVISLIDQRTSEVNVIKDKKKPSYIQKCFDMQVQDLAQEVRKLTAENEKHLETIKALEKDARKSPPKRTLSQVQAKDKGIMVNLYNEVALQVQTVASLSTYLTGGNVNQAGSILTRPLVLSIINMIYSDKMLKDLLDDAERRPRKPLSGFFIEWFLTKVGLYSASELLIKDFLFTLKDSQAFDDRYKMFLRFIGVYEEPKTAGSKNSDVALDYVLVRRKCYATVEILRKYLKLLSYAKTLANNDAAYVGSVDYYGPLLLNKDTLNMQVAKSVIAKMAKEEGFSNGEIEELVEEFEIFQQYELYQKVEGNKLRDIDSVDRESEEGQSANFDLVANYMLNAIIQRRSKVLETVYTSLKANIGSQNEQNLAYEEFNASIERILPNCSRNWKDLAFAKIMDIPSGDKASLNQLIPNLIEVYFGEDQAKGASVVKKEKKMQSEIDLSRRSPKRNNQTDKNPRGGEESTQIFDFNGEAAEDGIYHYYDPVSSLIVLQEIYRILQPTIKAESQYNETLRSNNIRFRQDMKTLPANFAEVRNMRELKSVKRRELVDFLEHLWAELRVIIAHTFRK